MRALSVGKSTPVTGLAYSSDGDTLAAAAPWQAGRGSSAQTSVFFWDAVGGELRRSLRLENFFSVNPRVTFSPDGKRLALVAYSQALLDLDAPDPVQTRRMLDWFSPWGCLCFTDDSAGIHGLKDGTLAASDVGTGQPRTPLAIPLVRIDGWQSSRIALGRAAGIERFALAVMYSPRGRATTRRRFLVLLHDTDEPSRRPAIEWETDSQWFDGMVLAADGGRVAVIAGRTVRVWDADTSAELATLADGRKQPKAFAFSSDGRYLGVLFQDSVSLYDTTSWTVARTYAWQVGKLLSLAFSPDGATAAVGSEKGKVVVFDLE